MGFLSLFTGPRLAPAWRYETGGLVWRIVPSDGRKILGEVRTVNTKTVWFFCLDERDGTVLWEKRDFGLGWWCGVEGVAGGTAFLHRFPAPDLPVRGGIHAVDISTGSLLWSADALRFLSAGGDSLYAEDEGTVTSMTVELNPRTGERRGVLASGTGVPRGPAAAGAARFPVPLAAMEDREAAALVSARADGAPSGAEVLTHGGAVIAFTGTDLMILARTGGRELYRERLTAEPVSVVPESFFVRGDMLVFVRERTVLTAVDLSPLRPTAGKGDAR